MSLYILICCLAAFSLSTAVNLPLPFSSLETDNFSEDDSSCDAVVSLFELYNITNKTLNQIRELVANVSIWEDEESLEIPTSAEFGALGEKPTQANQKPDSDITFPPTTSKPSENNANDSDVPIKVIVTGVLPPQKDNFTSTLKELKVEYKDMDHTICMRFMENPPPNSDYDFDTDDKDTWSNQFTLPIHLADTIYTNVFYSIIIESLESSASPAPDQVPFSYAANSFGYYVSLGDSGIVRVEHGSIPNDSSTQWAWVLANHSNPATNTNITQYHLVNMKQPKRKVIAGPDGDLMLSTDITESIEYLNFTPTFVNETEKAQLLVKFRNDTFCLFPYFATTLRLMLTNAEGQGCTILKFQMGEVTVKSAKYNTTFIDLHTTNTTEWIEHYSNEMPRLPINEEKPEVSAVFYFNGEPTDLHLFLGSQMVTSTMQDLHNVADDILEKGVVCRESQLQANFEIRPLLSCMIHRYAARPMPYRKNRNQTTTVKPAREVKRWSISRETNIKLFKDLRKFQFVTKGLTSCKVGKNQTEVCGRKMNMPEGDVRDLLSLIGVANTEMVAGEDNTLYYWMEGLAIFTQKKITPYYK